MKSFCLIISCCCFIFSSSYLPIFTGVRDKDIEMLLRINLQAALFCLLLLFFLQELGGIHKNLLYLLVRREVFLLQEILKTVLWFFLVDPIALCCLQIINPSNLRRLPKEAEKPIRQVAAKHEQFLLVLLQKIGQSCGTVLLVVVREQEGLQQILIRHPFGPILCLTEDMIHTP